MQAQAQNEIIVSDVAAGLASAREWLIATTKLAGLAPKVVFVREGELVSNVTNVGCENHARIDKFKAMVRRARDGFDKSKDWECTRNEYNGWTYVSSDGKWQVTITDRYNGSGGWKVATMTVGIAIRARKA